MNTKKKPAVEQEVDDDVQNDAIIGKALKMSLGLAAVVGCVVLGIAAIAWFNRKPPEEIKTELVLPVRRKPPEIAKPAIPLANITEAAGIDWKHFNAMEGEKLLPEPWVAAFRFSILITMVIRTFCLWVANPGVGRARFRVTRGLCACMPMMDTQVHRRDRNGRAEDAHASHGRCGWRL